MIRTQILPCKLDKDLADYLNRSSGKIYTDILVNHWRVMRKKSIWLSEKLRTRISDSLTNYKLHSGSIDAAQQSFDKACNVARTLKKIDPTVRYPHWTKKFRTTIWKNNAIKLITSQLRLSTGVYNPKIYIDLSESLLQTQIEFKEVRLVFDKKAREYKWHIVYENNVQPQENSHVNVVSVDLGEIHPAVVGDEFESTIILCRERRHEVQGHAKRLASISQAISRKAKGSRRFKRLIRVKSKMKAKHERIVKDMAHKVSRAIVDVAIERQANTIVFGDIRNIAKEVALGKKANQKISGWNHGEIRRYVEYKAEELGIKVELINEAYSSQTCPNCNVKHKPKGRVYLCPSCKSAYHRDVVGQTNILSLYKYHELAKIAVPSVIKHRLPYDVRNDNIRLKRRCLDIGQSQKL